MTKTSFFTVTKHEENKRALKCNCGAIVRIAGGDRLDNYPEYTLDIYVQCMLCRASVKFTVGVN